MINFTRAFDSAWERMHIILFRPFDFGKWCAIGLSAFLAGLLEGGNGFNSSYQGNFNNDDFNKYTGSQSPKIDWNHINSNISHAFTNAYTGMIVLISLGVIVFVFALIFLMYWLGARGEFMFIDNIVRNRGAIAWPWQTYGRQANSLFGFYLLFLVISFAIFIPILVVAILMIIPLFQHQRWPEGGEIAGFVALVLVYLGAAIVLGFVMFIFREFGVPIMFRQGLLARPAFWKAMGLIRQHTGSVVIFVLLRIAIFIGVAILSVILCCLTCCIELIPYVGTVILLPVLVYVRCFTLDCLAQFGPEYDVWIVDVAPPPPFNPQPPLL
jgi:hypothetical protein